MSTNGNGDNQLHASAAPRRSATKTTATATADRQLQRSHLQKLNEVVSVATRRVFQSPLLLQHSLTDPSAIRQQLPELCAFVDALFQASDAATNNKNVAGSIVVVAKSAQRNAAIVRRVFRDPDAQWLTRSAMQSGASALLCGQLLRCAEEHFAAQQDPVAAKLVILLLCDQLLTSCTLRLGAFSRNCEWRDRKPAYHAMPCFATWDTLFPFLERMAKRFPQLCTEVFATYTCETRRQDMPTRVNCTFAHVVGLWRLMESLGGGSGFASQGSSIPVRVAGGPSGDSTAAMLSLLDSVLQFTVRSRVLEVVVSDENPSQQTDEENQLKSAAFFDDLLMDKFFSGLQEFMFSCPRSKSIARHALQSAIVDSIVEFTSTQGPHSEDPDPVPEEATSRSVPAGLAVFTGVSCLFVKGLASSIVTRLLTSLRSSTISTSTKSLDTNPLLLFIVGFCAHVDLVPIGTVLGLLSDLLDMYARLDASHQELRIQAVFFMMYVAIYRTDAVYTLRREHGDTINNSSSDDGGGGGDDSVEANPYLDLLNFQDRFTGEVDSAHFYALPVEWMALFWKEWFAFSEDDLASFISGYGDYRQQHQEVQTGGEPLEAVAITKRLQEVEGASQIAFRDVDGVFVKQLQLLRPHFIAPAHIDTLLLGSLQSGEQDDSSSLKRLLSESLYGTRQHLKNKKQRRALAPVNPEAEERKLNVLMLPEVMETVCSFMSAKRLCRLAVVCQAFAEISRSSRLWQQLYSSLTSKDLEPVSCNHDANYQHDWRTMYRQRWDARKKLRKRQRAVNTTHQRLLLAHDPDSIDITTGANTTTVELLPAEPFTVRLCHFCGCHRMLSSQSQMEEHLKTHRQFKCEVGSSCGATFPSLAQLKKHIKQLHPTEEDSSGAAAANQEAKKKPRIACGFAGCTRSYTSAKRLETHRKLENHYV